MKTEALDLLGNTRPVFREKFLTLSLDQALVRAAFNKHPEAAFFLDQVFVNQFLIGFKNGEGIYAIIRGHRSHGRKRVFLLQHALENHVHNAIAKLAINGLTVIPFASHYWLQHVLGTAASSNLGFE